MWFLRIHLSFCLWVALCRDTLDLRLILWRDITLLPILIHQIHNLSTSVSSVKVSIVGSLRDREVACPASDRQGSNFEPCVWRTVSSQSSHHAQEVPLAQFSLYVHKGGLKPNSFHFIFSGSDWLHCEMCSVEIFMNLTWFSIWPIRQYLTNIVSLAF